jgi:hypothetical protein
MGEKEGEDKRSNEEETVILKPEQYNALLDKIADLEELALKGSGKTKDGEEEDLEAIAAAAKEKGNGRGQDKPIDWDKLSSKDLANLVVGHVDVQMVQPILTELYSLRIRQDIKDFIQDEKITDFKDYKKDIYEICSKNPNMSIADAYYTAKSKKERSAKPEDDEERIDKGSERHRGQIEGLPPRRGLPKGERPGRSSSVTSEDDPETRTDAAKRAIEKLKKEGHAF